MRKFFLPNIQLIEEPENDPLDLSSDNVTSDDLLPGSEYTTYYGSINVNNAIPTVYPYPNQVYLSINYAYPALIYIQYSNPCTFNYDSTLDPNTLYTIYTDAYTQISEPFYFHPLLQLSPNTDNIYYGSINVNNAIPTVYPYPNQVYLSINYAYPALIYIQYSNPCTFNYDSTLDPNTLYTIYTDAYTQISEPFYLKPTQTPTFWTNTFAVGGVAVTGGEAQSNNTFNLNANYNAFKNTTWDTNSNLVRVPIVWAYLSKDNSDYTGHVLFTNENQDLTNTNVEWEYDANYASAIKNIVSDCVSKNKVVILDYHTYTQWNGINKTSDIIANIWMQTLKVFNGLDQNLFKNSLVWFEIVNEPYTFTVLTEYTVIISKIRNMGYTNKIIMGLDAFNAGGHVVSNSSPNSFDDGFNAYSGGFPTDTANNLCVTLHQYFNQNGSGANYDSNDSMCTPSWLINGNTLTNGTTLENVLNEISTKCGSNCDIILGEFGYDTRYSSNVGKTAVQKLLDTMNQINTNRGANRNSTDILTKTQGGVWLGFAAWVSGLSYDSIENSVDDAMFNATYSQYFN